MKRIVLGKVTDAYTVKTNEPLIPGQEVFIVTEALDAEGIFALARLLTERGQPDSAFQLLCDHEEVVRERCVFPFADAVVVPLLQKGCIDKALQFARQIEDKWEHDVALGRVAMHVFNQGDPQKAKEILKEMHDERRRKWGEFLIDWGLMLKKAQQSLSPEELQRLVVNEWGD